MVTTEPTRALQMRLQDIIRRRENPTEPCEAHPGELAANCPRCRSERIADGGDSTGDRDDWLTKLASAECDRRFPLRYVTAEPDQPDVQAWVKRYLTDRHTCPSLLILGAVGTGKTHQAYGALRLAVTQPRAVRWHAATCADMYASVRPRSNLDTEAALDVYRKADLLMLDDLGAAKGSEWTEEITYRVLNHRYEQCLPSIYTTNLDPQEITTALGGRIASRLAESCMRVVLTGGDRRKKAS